MKRSIIISLVVLLTIGLYAQVVNSKLSNSTYIDDSYYWPLVDTIVPTEPVYDRSAREFIFLEDTTQYPDTVVMRIVEK
jgi:hypothetical protein